MPDGTTRSDPAPRGDGSPAAPRAGEEKSASPTPAPARGILGPPPSGERRTRVLGWRSRDILRATALVVGFWLFLKLLWIANPLLLTAFLGILFGLAVESGVDRLERFRIPRGVGAALIVLLFYGSLVGLAAWMSPTLREQSRELRNRLPQAVDKVEQWLNARREGVFGILLGGSEVTGRGTPDTTGPAAQQPAAAPDTLVSRVDTSTVVRTDAPAARPQTEAQPEAQPGPGTEERREPGGAGPTLRDRLSRQVTGAARYLFPFLSSTVAIIGGLLLITFLAIYIAAEPDLYHRGLMHLFPHSARQRAGEVLTATATALRKWLVTQLIAMVVVGSVTTILLLLLRVKAAFALGVIAGLLEFIPTIGPLLSAVPAVAMAFLDSPDKALAVIAVYVGVQFMENHLLIPLLMKEGVGLPPALTVLTQALMAIVFGFLGLLVAVPMLAAVMVAVKMLYVEGVVGDDVDVLEREA